MHPLIKFNKNYFALALLLFLVEVFIAKFVHDAFVRPYLGDVLVVMLIYCVVKAFLNTPVLPTAMGVLVFSFIIEGLQYLNMVEKLGLQHSKMANIVMGNTFAWMDIVCYIAGVGLILLFERKNRL